MFGRNSRQRGIDGDDDAYVRALLARHIASQGWEHPADDVGISLDVLERPASRIYLASVGDGDTGPRRGLLAKLPLRRHPGPDSHAVGDPGRPRLAPITDVATKHGFEHAALSAVALQVTDLDDPRLGAVKVLDHVPARGIIVMEAVLDPTLQALLDRRRHAAGETLVEAFANVGVWLRAFHAMDPPPGVRPRYTRGSDVHLAMARLVDFLLARGAPEGPLDRVARLLDDDDSSLIPDDLPLSWSHGDFAARNVFVAAGNRVSVFDIVGRWQAPVYYDLAYFLVALRSPRRRVLTQGWVARWQADERLARAFLEGYGDGQEPSMSPLGGFELLLLLDRWAAVRGSPPRLPVRPIGYAALTDRFFSSELARALDGIEHGRRLW